MCEEDSQDAGDDFDADDKFEFEQADTSQISDNIGTVTNTSGTNTTISSRHSEYYVSDSPTITASDCSTDVQSESTAISNAWTFHSQKMMNLYSQKR